MAFLKLFASASKWPVAEWGHPCWWEGVCNQPQAVLPLSLLASSCTRLIRPLISYIMHTKSHSTASTTALLSFNTLTLASSSRVASTLSHVSLPPLRDGILCLLWSLLFSFEFFHSESAPLLHPASVLAHCSTLGSSAWIQDWILCIRQTNLALART